MAVDANPHRVGLIPEHPSKRGGRLGRHIHFDERSRGFRVPLRAAAKIVSRTWDRDVKPFDQGAIGSCTGNAAVGVLATAPFRTVRKKGVRYANPLAREVYSQATKMDVIAGVYPPKDTGSTVLAAMKALKKLGLAKGYDWCFGLDDVLRTISTIGPVELGVNWYEGFDRPDKSGRVKVSGSLRGGHAFEVLGVDAKAKTVLAVNSWGTGYAAGGYFSFSWKDLDRLLQESGEASTLIVKTPAAKKPATK
jgi:hypothetical protein